MTSIDELNCQPYPGIDTVFKGFQRNLNIMPDAGVMGTRVGDKYEWVTWRELAHITEHLSYGIIDAGLCPEVAAEGTTYRFMGI